MPISDKNSVDLIRQGKNEIALLRKNKTSQTNQQTNSQTETEFLENYKKNLKETYEKPSVTVDVLVFTVVDKDKKTKTFLPDKVLKVLLIKRKNHPYKGDWALPGGFVNINESLDDAARRELKEETSVENIYVEQLYTWGDVQRDPRMRVISASYLALIDSSKVEIKAGDDADECAWFTIKKEVVDTETTHIQDGVLNTETILITLESGSESIMALLKKETEIKADNTLSKSTVTIEDSVNIAFDHIKIINYALERLANKIEYTPIAFNLVSQQFTLTELQKIYEAILDKKFTPPNFRKKIKSMVIETDEQTKDAAHRPAKLYRYNTLWGLSKF